MSSTQQPDGVDMSEQKTSKALFEIRKVYVKDISYESPQTPQIFTRDEEPTIDVQIRMDNTLLDKENGFYESVITVTVTAKTDADTVFLCEIQQAGIFQITNASDEELEIALEVACPTTLFPYVRETISEMVGKGGFPQLLLNPINFESMYRRKNQEEQTDGEDRPSQVTH